MERMRDASLPNVFSNARAVLHDLEDEEASTVNPPGHGAHSEPASLGSVDLRGSSSWQILTWAIDGLHLDSNTRSPLKCRSLPAALRARPEAARPLLPVVGAGNLSLQSALLRVTSQAARKAGLPVPPTARPESTEVAKLRAIMQRVQQAEKERGQRSALAARENTSVVVPPPLQQAAELSPAAKKLQRGKLLSVVRRWMAAVEHSKEENAEKLAFVALQRQHRVFQAWRRNTAALRAAKTAAAAAREGHLEEIALSFRQLWLAHATLRSWRVLPGARREAEAKRAAAVEEHRALQAKGVAADRFRRLFLLHATVCGWKAVAADARLARQLAVQHCARRDAMERAVQAALARQQLAGGNSVASSVLGAPSGLDTAQPMGRDSQAHAPAAPSGPPSSLHHSHQSFHISGPPADLSASGRGNEPSLSSCISPTSKGADQRESQENKSPNCSQAEWDPSLSAIRPLPDTAGLPLGEEAVCAPPGFAPSCSRQQLSGTSKGVPVSPVGFRGQGAAGFEGGPRGEGFLGEDSRSSVGSSGGRPGGRGGVSRQQRSVGSRGAESRGSREDGGRGLEGFDGASGSGGRGAAAGGAASQGVPASTSATKGDRLAVLKARRDEARLQAEARQEAEVRLARRQDQVRYLEKQQAQQRESAVAEIRRQLIAQQVSLARMHHSRTLLQRAGWRPWRRHLAEAASKAGVAAAHADRQAAAAAMLGWQAVVWETRQAAAREEQMREAAAAQFACRALQRRAMAALWCALELRRAAWQEAEVHARGRLLAQVLGGWLAAARVEAEEREVRELLQMHEASRHAATFQQRRAVAGWRSVVVESLREREEKALKEQRRTKIDAWLQEHRSSKPAESGCSVNPDFLQDLFKMPLYRDHDEDRQLAIQK